MVHHEKYERSVLKEKIVHIGFGAFHRAHQALYTDELAQITNSDWGYCEVGLFGGEQLLEDLKKQDHLFSVVEKGTNSINVKTVSSVVNSLHLTFDGSDKIVEKIASPETCIVSITITEKGYGISLQTKRLDQNSPFIKADLNNFSEPKSAIGCIVKGLQIRKERGLTPISILSCDNMPENGVITCNAVLDFAEIIDSELKQWIEANITFPSTMVDRIVPALTDESQIELDRLVGEHDPCGIIGEEFRQWVIEDNFANGRPDWDLVGAEFVSDVLPYEQMKLRMLNGSHSFLAYVGYLSGYDHISDCMKDENIKLAAYKLMMEEQAITLKMPDGVDLEKYGSSLIERYCNDNIKHRTWQIAMDGSQKLPQRLLESVSDHIENNRQYPFTCLAVAAWIRYVSAVDLNGNEIDVRDPQASELKTMTRSHKSTESLVRTVLSNEAIFKKHISENENFFKSVVDCYNKIILIGTKQTVSELVS